MKGKSAVAVLVLTLALPAKSAETAIRVSTSAELSFGKLAVGGAPGTVTVSPTGGRSTSGGVVALSGDPGHPARLVVTGPVGATYSISVPPLVVLQDGASTMEVDAITVSTGAAELLTGGTRYVTVGGTLHVAAHQADGAYSGSLTVTLDYN